MIPRIDKDIVNLKLYPARRLLADKESSLNLLSWVFALPEGTECIPGTVKCQGSCAAGSTLHVPSKKYPKIERSDAILGNSHQNYPC